MRYRDKRGQRRFESTGCTDWQEANQKLRARLTARDQNVLEVVRKGEHRLRIAPAKSGSSHFAENRKFSLCVDSKRTAD